MDAIMDVVINTWPYLLILIAIIVVARFFSAQKHKGTKSTAKTNNGPYLYNKRPSLLTDYELKFYRELLPAATAKGLVVFAKVRISDLIEAQRGQGAGATNRIDRKHIDFVLCDRTKLLPVLLVELDDSSHQRPDRIERDNFVDEAMQSANMPILHVTSSRDIAGQIARKLGAPVAARR